METNCVHIYYGYGKGKSTASAGLAVRALGAGKRVLVAAFLKDGNSAELAILEKLGADVRFAADCKGFYGFMDAENQRICKENQLALLGGIPFSDFDVVILDEFLDLIDVGILSISEAEAAIKSASCELILTGHKFVEEFEPLADYITHFDCKKHPYGCKNLAPRRGIEF